jgi:deazaflavin-dependent oxidoreductase (nitroreductase family)
MTTVPRPPSAARLTFYRYMNPVMRLMIRLGSGGRGADLLRVLRVRGRTSGRLYEVPVRMAVLDGHRYLMTMMGDAQWARNLRAAGQGQLVLGRSAEQVRAREIDGQEKTAFLTRCCRYRQFERRARSALKSAFGQNVTSLGPPDIELLSQVWFVFHLEQAKPLADDRVLQ